MTDKLAAVTAREELTGDLATFLDEVKVERRGY